MSKKITAVGEVLIDLTQTGVNEAGIREFRAYPGGAPANVVIAAHRLGLDAAFIGCVGKDSFGDSLRATLENDGVDTTALLTSDVPTTMAVVTVDETGERSFSFYRGPGADITLEWENIPKSVIDTCDVLHFGSVSLTDDPARTATLKCAEYAREKGKIVTYDPNYRARLWKSEADAMEQMRRPIPMADIIKISDEETALMTGEASPEGASKILCDQGAKLVLVTLGANGVFYRCGEISGHVSGFKVKVADTNGAGDTFFGAFLSRLLRREGYLAGITEAELVSMLKFANKAASLTTSRPGAIPAMPTEDEVVDYD